MRPWIFIGALNGFLGVTAGAVGAHVLGGRLSGPGLHYFDMAVQFQLWHGLALMAVGLLSPYHSRGRGLRLLKGAGAGFTAGTILFCGGLYNLAVDGTSGLHGVIPVGGLCLIGGWLSLTASSLYLNSPGTGED
jgi:uncharacterized membrane protein YgdD (TMEM256/DUF423 family)